MEESAYSTILDYSSYLPAHGQGDALSFVDTWRSRLFSISWCLKFLNDGIARRANKEDERTGQFWESRYKSQALLDEQAALSCMASIDLNPIRAGMAKTPEQSDHTSIQQRITHWKAKGNSSGATTDNKDDFQPKSLMPFVGNHRLQTPPSLAFKYGIQLPPPAQTWERLKHSRTTGLRSCGAE